MIIIIKIVSSFEKKNIIIKELYLICIFDKCDLKVIQLLKRSYIQSDKNANTTVNAEMCSEINRIKEQIIAKYAPVKIFFSVLRLKVQPEKE